MLVKRVEEKLKRKRCKFILASTNSENIRARTFFTKLGYVGYTLNQLINTNRRLLGEIYRKIDAYGDDYILVKNLNKPYDRKPLETLERIVEGKVENSKVKI